MAADYTVIIAVRQRFGDSPRRALGIPRGGWGECPIQSESAVRGGSPRTSFSTARTSTARQFGVLDVQLAGGVRLQQPSCRSTAVM